MFSQIQSSLLFDLCNNNLLQETASPLAFLPHLVRNKLLLVLLETERGGWAGVPSSMASMMVSRAPPDMTTSAACCTASALPGAAIPTSADASPEQSVRSPPVAATTCRIEGMLLLSGLNTHGHCSCGHVPLPSLFFGMPSLSSAFGWHQSQQ